MADPLIGRMIDGRYRLESQLARAEAASADAQGQLAAARESYTESLSLYRTLGVPWDIADALLGLARKYGESPKIVHALAAHHEDEKPETILAVLVQAADALSGARPGARREMLETYVKRLDDLERMAADVGGVGYSMYDALEPWPAVHLTEDESETVCTGGAIPVGKSRASLGSGELVRLTEDGVELADLADGCGVGASGGATVAAGEAVQLLAEELRSALWIRESPTLTTKA